MMSQELVTELLRYCKSTFGIDLSPSSGPRDLLAAELGLLKCLVRLGRAAMQRWCQQLGDGDRGARASKDGVSYRRVGQRAKTIHGLFGWVSYVRVCYARVGAGGAGWAPLDEQLGLQRGYTSGCQYFMAYFCWAPGVPGESGALPRSVPCRREGAGLDAQSIRDGVRGEPRIGAAASAGDQGVPAGGQAGRGAGTDHRNDGGVHRCHEGAHSCE